MRGLTLLIHSKYYPDTTDGMPLAIARRVEFAQDGCSQGLPNQK